MFHIEFGNKKQARKMIKMEKNIKKEVAKNNEKLAKTKDAK